MILTDSTNMWKIQALSFYILTIVVKFAGVDSQNTRSLPAPTGLTDVDVTAQWVKLRWDAQGNDAIIQYKPKRDRGGFAQTKIVRKSEFTVRRLQPYTVYLFKVAAVSSDGIGPYSDPIQVRTGELGL